jgi:hypothetical protein
MYSSLLLADQISTWITIAVFVISILGWLVNTIKGVDANGNPLPNRQRPRPEGRAKPDLRSEIEVFIEELKQPQRPQPQGQPPNQRANPSANRGPDRPRGERTPKKKKEQTAKSAAKTSPKGEAASGSKLREHVASYMAENRVGAEVQQHLAHRVDQAVQKDLSGGTVAPISAAPGLNNAPPHPLLVMLSKPEGMRQAILLNEILQKPRVLTRERK